MTIFLLFYSSVTVRLKNAKLSTAVTERKRLMRKIMILAVLALSLTVAVSGVILAANAYYNVTSNLVDPSNVAPGTNVVITAVTDENFESATFTWKNPAGVVVLQETVQFAGTPKTAVSDYVVDSGGLWKVTVYSDNGQEIGVFEYTVRLGFNVVPELPLIGTAGRFDRNGFRISVQNETETQSLSNCGTIFSSLIHFL